MGCRVQRVVAFGAIDGDVQHAAIGSRQDAGRRGDIGGIVHGVEGRQALPAEY
jgi:hypothetical protein